MGDWQKAWFLTKYDLSKLRWKHLLTLAFIGYLLLFIVPLYTEAVSAEDGEMIFWTLDFVIITLIPLLGFMSWQQMGFNWKANFHSKKLAQWRTMPISLRQIALGRLLALVVNLVPAVTLFFILHYFGVRMYGGEVDALTYAQIGIFWLGYSLVAGVIYAVMEIGYSGKVYFLFCLIFTIVLLFGTLMFSAVIGESIVVSLHHAIDQGAWWVSILGILAGVAALRIGLGAMEKRLRTRRFSD